MHSFSFPFPCTSTIQFKPPNPNPKTSPSPQTLIFRRPSAVSTTTSPETSASSSSLYEVLGISIGATNEEIKIAYRRLARSCHPDVAGATSDDFMRVNAAYSVLSDPVKRAEYDRKMGRVFRPRTRQFPGLSGSTTSSFCEFPRRNWETDQCW